MKLLFEHFELLADAPNGVPKLRELILQLAVRGKLVPQDPADEPAGELLKRIRAEKERLIAEGLPAGKAGKIKKEKPLPPITEEELPYPLPEGWVWCRLLDISKLITDGTHHSPQIQYESLAEGRFKYVTSKNVKDDGIDIRNITYVDQHVHQEIYSRCNPEFEDQLLIKDGAMTGVACLNNLDEEFSMLSSVALIKIFRDYVFPKYLNFYLKSPIGQILIIGDMKGVGIPRTTLKKIYPLLFPLPPLPEQKRIVAKVEQLMALCDELEQKQQQRRQKRIRLNNTALNKLLSAPTPQEFREHWQRIAGNFELLYEAPETVAQLKQAVLQLAVQGKLVKQDPADEPAGELLKRIRAEKERLIAEGLPAGKAGKIKKEKPLPPITDEELPYPLPDGWVWCRLGDVCEVNMGQSPDGATYNDNGDGVPLINGPVEFGKGHFDKTIKSKFTTSPTKMCKEGDLILCVRGSTTGRTNIAGFEACIGRGVAALRPYGFEKYLHYFILYSRNSIFNLGTGTTFPSISRAEIVNIRYPFPPDNEQKRIVAKVEELLNLCSALEEQLTRARQKRERLMAAVVHQALNGQEN